MDGKKRPRENDDMEEDDELYYDKIPTKDQLNLSSSSDPDVDMNGEVNVEFLFSELRDTYFHNIKTFIKPIFEFENVNMSELADLILTQKEVGSVIKTELEEETGNQNVDLLALTTILNLKHYADKNVIQQIKKYLADKVEQYGSEDSKFVAKKILDNEKIGFFINERAINLPMPLIPPLLNMIEDDIEGWNMENLGASKYEFEYVCMVSKFVQFTGQEPNQVRKRKTEAKKSNEIYYKFEDDYFARDSLAQIKYKIPYDKKFADFVENTNEPQYLNILFLKTADFYKVIKEIQSEDLKKFEN